MLGPGKWIAPLLIVLLAVEAAWAETPYQFLSVRTAFPVLFWDDCRAAHHSIIRCENGYHGVSSPCADHHRFFEQISCEGYYFDPAAAHYFLTWDFIERSQRRAAFDRANGPKHPPNAGNYCDNLNQPFGCIVYRSSRAVSTAAFTGAFCLAMETSLIEARPTDLHSLASCTFENGLDANSFVNGHRNRHSGEWRLRGQLCEASEIPLASPQSEDVAFRFRSYPEDQVGGGDSYQPNFAVKQRQLRYLLSGGANFQTSSGIPICPQIAGVLCASGSQSNALFGTSYALPFLFGPYNYGRFPDGTYPYQPRFNYGHIPLQMVTFKMGFSF